MRIATAWFLSTTLLSLGCNSAKKGNGNLDADISTVTGCVADPSAGPGSAASLAVGDKGTGMICPRGDQDFFTVQVEPGMNLLDVSLSYPSALSKVTLQARLFAADGVTEVPRATASDLDSKDGKNSVATTFAVPEPGSYVLRVSDAGDAAVDSVNTYVLQVAAATDPDPREPNDAALQAKPADSLSGYFSSIGDVDVFQITIASAGSLLQMKLTNPATAKAAIEYKIMDGAQNVLGTGSVPPAATPTDLTRPAPATGTLLIALQYPAGTAPDRTPGAAYTLSLAEIPETDANDKPPRNDTPATGTCLGGAGSPCAGVFGGTAVSFPAQSGTIGSRGDRDYFVFRATAAPAVVEATVRMPATAIDPAVDILVPHLPSACKADADCKVLAGTCTEDDDCELSHQCIEAKTGACATTTCRQCAGGGVCLALPDSPGQSACGVVLYSARDTDGGMKTGLDGANVVRTAQPVFNPGPIYIVVHDQQDDQYDPAAVYSLAVQVVPEPDAMDKSTDATARNNFYNPYPIQKTNLNPNRKRAKDITTQITAGTPIEGWLSYQTDEDWFWFAHPCPGVNCGLVFEFVQPGPSAVRPMFLLRTEDLDLHESWTYAGTLPTTAATTAEFGNVDCTQCSFASARHTASGSTPYRYYLQVRDAGADDWDFSSSGRYQFRLKGKTTGCPLACSEGNQSGTADAGDAGPCGCFCKSQNQCPAPLDL